MTNQKFRNFGWKVPPILAASLSQGKDAKRFYEKIKKDSMDFSPGSLKFLDYNSTSQTIRGSSIPRIGQINRLVSESGIRIAVPTDNIYSTIFPLIKGKFYTDLNALDVREKTQKKTENKRFLEKIM